MTPAEFSSLRTFVAVAQALSFSRAATALGVSPSSISQAVRDLEDRLGERLLNRTTRSVSLTEAGRRLLDRTAPAIMGLDAAIRDARGGGDRPTGTIRVHTFRIAADLFLTPLLGEFARDYPGIVLDVMLDDAVVDVVAGGFDAAIRIGEMLDQDFVAVRIGPELRQVAVASPAYLAAHGQPATPHDLARHRCIRWRWPGQNIPYAWEFQANGRWFAVAVDGPLIANDRAFGIAAAVDGAGIAFAVEEAIADHVAAGTLVRLLESWSAPFPGFFLCYPRQRHMTPALRAFVDAVRATAGRTKSGKRNLGP